MTIRVGINGYGRIGRNVLRALFESGRDKEIEIVAVNDLGDAKTNAHLTRYDSAHGPFPGTVEVTDDAMIVNGRNPAQFTAKGFDPVLKPAMCRRPERIASIWAALF